MRNSPGVTPVQGEAGWRLRHVGVAFSSALALLVLGVVVAFVCTGGEPSALVVMLLTQAALIGAVVTTARRAKMPWSAVFGTERLGSAACLACLVAGVGAFLLVGSTFATWATNDSGKTAAVVYQSLRADIGPGGILLLAGMLGPFAEELFFRGIVLRSLDTKLHTFLAVAITAMLFGVMHWNPVTTPSTVLIGLLCGAVMVWTGSLWAAVIVHASNNLVASGLGLMQVQAKLPIWSALIGVLLIAAGSAYLLRQRDTRPLQVVADEPRP